MENKLIIVIYFMLAVVCGAFPYHSNTATFVVNSSVSDEYDAFSWEWSDYDDQYIGVTFDVTYQTNSYGLLRLGYPKRGAIYLEVAGFAITTNAGAMQMSTIVPSSNIPPNNVYFAEFAMITTNLASNITSRVLANGRITTFKSQFAITNAADWTPIIVIPTIGNVLGISEVDPIWTATSEAFRVYGSTNVTVLQTATGVYISSSAAGVGSGTLTNLIGTGGIVVTGGGGPEATIDGSAFATGTPLYAYTETDPVWESEKSAYATGTPLYVESAETDPVWATASNRYAVVGPLTVDPVDLDMTWDGAIWTNASGYSSDGTNDTELGGWVLDPDEYIQTPLLADGYHSADIGFQTSGAFNYLSESYSRDGTTFEADPAAYDPFDGLPTIVRFFCPDLPPIGTNFYAIVTNLVINSYEYPANAIMTNDFLGVELRIRDSDESESPVRQDEFDAADAAIWQAVTNTYAPGVVGIDLEGNVLTFGSYWDSQQIADALVFSFAGNPVFTLSNGGTVIVSVASFSFDGEEIDMRVVCSALLEPTPQWSTNMTDWTSYSTNDFTTTWPNLTNGIALLEFAAQTGETAAVYYRAIAAGTNAGPGTATLTVPLIVNGTITADGFIGDGSGLTGIVASVTGGVNSAGGLVGDIEFTAGDNMEITTNGQSLVFASTGGGGDLTALSNDVLGAWGTASNAQISADGVGADLTNRFTDGYTVPAWNGAAITGLTASGGSDTGAVQKVGDTMSGALNFSSTDILITNAGAAHGITIGNGATCGESDGNSAIAIGIGAVGSISTADRGVAIGAGANGNSEGTAIGYLANGYGGGAAIGRSAFGGNYGTAVGYSANAGTSGAGTSVGRDSAAKEYGDTAIGYIAQALYGHGTAIGSFSYAKRDCIALGYYANANGTTNIAIGLKVTNNIPDSTAIRGSLYLDGGTGLFFRTTFGSGDWGPALIVKSMSGTNELVAVDPDGNETQLSAHDVIDGKMVSVAKSHNTFTGRGIMIDLEAMAREVEKLSGSKIVREYQVPKADWNLVEAQKEANRIADRAAWSNQFAAFSAKPLILVTNIVDGIEEIKEEGTPDPGPLPPTYKPRPKPGWLVAAESVEVEK